MNTSVTDRTVTAAAVRVLALVALFAVRAHCALSNGLHDGYGYGGGSGGTSTGGGGGGVRFAKLDRFLHDRMGEPPALSSTDRAGFLSRTTAASVAVRPEDEDKEDDGDVDEDGADDDDRDGQENEDENYEREPVRMQQPIRLRHSSRRKLHESDPYDQYVQNQEPVRTMSPISESKWKQFGTRKAVDNAFRDLSKKGTVHVLPQGDKENNEVTKHQSRVLKETMCKVPRSRVVKVIDHYPSSNKKYLPSCTVLHLCADDTGCCGSPMLKCGPKSSEPILLHFIVYTYPELSDRQSRNQSLQSYQTLRFYNHTECHCQPKDDDSMPKDASIMPTPTEADNPPVVHRTDNDCKCPMEYTVRYLANGSCSCDCFDKQHECIRYKKGNIYFNFLDRYCISSGQCLMPMCEYGLYSHQTGRCPKKFDTLYSFKNKHYF